MADKHGLNGYSNLKCRCVLCTRAWAEYFSSYKKRLALKEPPTHGYNGYTNYSCRCALCTAANAVYAKDYYRRTHSG